MARKELRREAESIELREVERSFARHQKIGNIFEVVLVGVAWVVALSFALAVIMLWMLV
jgi:hypothetical protein